MTANKMMPKIRRDEEALDQADFVRVGVPTSRGDDADERGQQDQLYQESIDEGRGTCGPARSPRLK